MYIPKTIKNFNENGTFKIEKKENNLVEYEQVYVSFKGITIIIKNIYYNEEPLSTELLGFYEGEPNIEYSFDILKSSHPLIGNYNNPNQIIKNTTLTEFEKLCWAEKNGAHTIEITLLDKFKQVPEDLFYHGCAYTINNKFLRVFYGSEDGSDDKIVSKNIFNKKFKVTNILF